ncbi:hypothetical protein J1614_005356 [Plenodomus biglobosus]|nr:hypothetical protein J1614_005356 [Plenodomus biglobosus]
MLLTIKSSLLLLPLSSAILEPSSSPKDIVQQRVGCHNRFNANSEMIVFRSPSQNAFEFAIITPYKKYYAKLLKYALQANDFKLTSWQYNQACGWQKRDSVYGPLGINSANHRGDMY